MALKTPHLCLGACFLLLLVFFLAPVSYLTGYYAAMRHYSDQDSFVYYYPEMDYKIDRNNPDEANIVESREYQVKLNATIYQNRTAGVEDLLNFIRNYTGLKLKDKDFKTDIYEEIQYLPEDCGKFYDELRKRKYYGDKHPNPKEDSTVVSINIDSSPHHFKKNAMEYSLHPAPQYINDSDEKIEQDIHHDFRKFNRETKVKNLPTDFEFTKCSEVMEMFPQAFPNTTDPDQPISIRTNRSTKYIWDYSISDKIYFGTTKIKLAWTLYFRTLDACYDPLALSMDGYSEFSFRVYSLGEGYASWNKDALTYVAKFYLAVLDFYSIPPLN